MLGTLDAKAERMIRGARSPRLMMEPSSARRISVGNSTSQTVFQRLTHHDELLIETTTVDSAADGNLRFYYNIAPATEVKPCKGK